jgi:hypothetical protein
MFSGERTKSTQPTAMALRGIELCRADSSWAKVILPSALIATSPGVPSVAVPDRITPIVRAHPRQQEYDLARELTSASAVLIVSYFGGVVGNVHYRFGRELTFTCMF